MDIQEITGQENCNNSAFFFLSIIFVLFQVFYNLAMLAICFQGWKNLVQFFSVRWEFVGHDCNTKSGLSGLGLDSFFITWKKPCFVKDLFPIVKGLFI
ncbi:MAG: hypothetical protein ACKO11_11315 [Cuspidothrix sp.]